MARSVDLADVLFNPHRYLLDGKPMVSASMWVGTVDYEVNMDSTRIERITQAHCMCPACKDGNLHASDCSVHNAPALPISPCDCGAVTQ